MATFIPVDIKDAPLGIALEAIYTAVTGVHTRLDVLENMMADLTPALERLEAASTQIIALVGNGGELAQALADERAANAALVQAAAELEAVEASEDVAQNSELAAQVEALRVATEATDSAFSRIESVATSLETAATGPVTPEEPVNP